MSKSITAGQEVTYQGERYVVRSIDGNVLALEYHTGGFFRFVHLSSVIACSPSAIQTAATSLDAPAAGRGEGTQCLYCGGCCLLPAAARLDAVMCPLLGDRA